MELPTAKVPPGGSLVADQPLPVTSPGCWTACWVLTGLGDCSPGTFVVPPDAQKSHVRTRLHKGWVHSCPFPVLPPLLPCCHSPPQTRQAAGMEDHFLSRCSIENKMAVPLLIHTRVFYNSSFGHSQSTLDFTYTSDNNILILWSWFPKRVSL